ncbi:hypothetical protein FE782_10905 [Paenibacillus antri]|uniref:Beta-galactosidase trimerisation domain-containing protein n=1 Tax=Paenibacillus antri TaxID=2582848 RepID=A0A5R9GL36_9BACL|nr:hypothetical protein [Paenibacillus antri]TLS52465.1 hypothetical protein FE782_10905 [Paenibacillus antri]
MNRSRTEERTGFQIGAPYGPTYDLQTDFVMVYGVGPDMPDRIRQWADRGYEVHLMTGVSWGSYQDYLNGKVDGREHWDEAQMNRYGETIIHGTSKDIPYMVPTIAFTDFLTNRIKRAVDAGVEAIHLEEPEFWVEGGYSEAFKREWQIYYNEPWVAPHESVDAQFRSAKLKAYLYTRCLDRLCAALKEYAMIAYNRHLRFYVPTHSLINYTQWRIVSPESWLLDLPTIDGYIAQIWTGTSRTPNVYEGKRKERTFETAFLEYGAMQELVRGTNRRMWFLHDPIEDDPEHTWRDYRENYLKTVVASLLHPHISHYEVAPWPSRIFEGKYPKEDGDGREGIPDHYATLLLNVMHTLGDMQQEVIRFQGENCMIGVLLSDSAMYQRNVPGASESETSFKYDGTVVESAQGSDFRELLDWSPFYGLTLPLLKHGMTVRPVQLENIRRYPAYLDDYRVLVLSYEFMKPESPDIHNAITDWVRGGGILVYVGDGRDPFHSVRAWWNQGKRGYATPAEHLFGCLGLNADANEGIHSLGKGIVGYVRLDPAVCAKTKEGADRLRRMVADAITALGDQSLQWSPKNYFLLHRGPYVIAAVLDESVSPEPLVLNGMYVNLFDPNLSVTEHIEISPGDNALLYDLNSVPVAEEPSVIAASSRTEQLSSTHAEYSFTAKGPERVQAVACIRSKKKPASVRLEHAGTQKEMAFTWHEQCRTLHLQYPNHPDGVTITLLFS